MRAMMRISDWPGNVGRAWAQQWVRTDRSFAPLTACLLAEIADQPGRTIVDVGCGAGELAIAVARVRPEAQVFGIDISAELLNAATMRGSAQSNLQFALGDAARWQPVAKPDLFISRHGVMFFADPVAAFSHMAAVAAPGAHFIFSCFREMGANPWISEIAALLPVPTEPEDPYAPGPFAFADPGHVRACLSLWTGITFTPVDYDYVAGEGAEAIEDAVILLSTIGPAARAAAAMSDEAHATFVQALRELVEARFDGQRVAFPAAAWIVRATRSL